MKEDCHGSQSESTIIPPRPSLRLGVEADLRTKESSWRIGMGSPGNHMLIRAIKSVHGSKREQHEEQRKEGEEEQQVVMQEEQECGCR